ncbi:uncharacterized protein LOC107860780 [Capsicum annuum]|uniref:uncharacterized protein LOC107860780 n=1 Tax=Capsicum annuum TaxID=4072 RepID=UPI001FB0C4BB|nr:uncharacterized protein LOC107860780 [Capsicum annuum]
MALVLRYVDKNGEVVERFIGLVHVSDTSACSLKKEIYSLLSDHSLSPSKIRGQGYDGASNMKGEINVEDFFDHVTNVLNVVGGSFKCRDLLRHHQAENLKQLLESGDAHTGQGLHQECGLQRPGDTRWGSHFKILDNFLVIFSSIVHVLEVIEIEGSTSSDRNQAEYLLTKIESCQFFLLLGIGRLNPVNSFSNFDKGRIMTLAKYYPSEFDDGKLRDLSYQLDTFIIHMRGGNSKFSNLQRIRDLAKALVEANLVETNSLVYLLVKLTLILPVATETVERAFSSMKHNMKTRRGQL